MAGLHGYCISPSIGILNLLYFTANYSLQSGGILQVLREESEEAADGVCSDSQRIVIVVGGKPIGLRQEQRQGVQACPGQVDSVLQCACACACKPNLSPLQPSRLSQDIVDKQEARTKNSRRRMTIESADIDHISDRNAAFNKKIKRAFDKYTVEIRQNLERGTAV